MEHIVDTLVDIFNFKNPSFEIEKCYNLLAMIDMIDKSKIELRKRISVLVTADFEWLLYPNL